MNKISKILLSILISGLASINTGTPDASALYIDEDDNTWYTVAELLEYKEELDQAAATECGDDMSCLRELYSLKEENRDQKYLSLKRLAEQQIIITSINPEQETIKVLFFDEDMDLKYRGISRPLTLGEFYAGWFEYDVGRIYNYGYYSDELFSETLDGAHLIYAQRDNTGNKIPSNQEFEISISGSNLVADTSGEIAYGAYADPYFNVAGRFVYSSCLDEPDYHNGTECKMMISADMGTRYFPPRETTKIQDNTEGDDETNMDGINEETETTVATNDTVTSRELDDREVEAFSNQTDVKSPNTGAMTHFATHLRKVELPWWIAVLVIANTALFIWWVMPDHKKSPKNRKKSIDKKDRLE